MRYRPEIDGLRALAIAGVLGFHFPLGCKGGYLGVDVFLVISGYLMTRLLEKEIRQRKFSWKAFAQRRIRRLLPALAAAVLVTLFVGSQLLSPYHFQQLSGASAAVGLLGSNFYHWWAVPEGYFAGQRAAQPLLHTWSLSLEEQYYLLLPAALSAVAGWGLAARRKALGVALLASAGLAVTLTASFPEAVFYLLPSRIWQFALGGLVALTPLRRHPVGVSLVGLLVLALNYYRAWPAASLWVSLATALLLQQRHPSRLWLAAPGLGWLGRRSYSLYLWHWPVVVLASYGLEQSPSPGWVAVQLLITLLLAEMSYRLIETPARRATAGQQRGLWLAVAGLLSLAMVGSGAVALNWGNHLQPWSQQARQLFATERESNFQIQAEISHLRQGNYARLGPEGERPRFLLWGDSQAMSIAAGLHALGRERQLAGLQITRYATPPAYLPSFHDPYGYYGQAWKEYEAEVYRALTQHDIRQVVLLGAWIWYDSPAFRESLAQSIDRLDRQGCSIWLVNLLPYSPYQVPRLLALGDGLPWWPLMPSVEVHQSRQRRFCDFEHRYPKAHVLDPARLMENNLGTGYEVIHRGQSLYRDGSHLSAAGGRYLRHLFDPVFDRIQR